jgi:thiol-disulfide isomerase/thioredoxin
MRPAATFAIILSIALGAASSLPGAAAAAPKVGQAAPDFTVETFGGHTLKLADLKGDVIVLNFWATWCGPCRAELPILDGLFRAYSPYGLQVLAVATEDSIPQNKLRPVAAALAIPFVKRMKGAYHDLDALPTSYIIDRSGKLVYAKAGAFDVDRFKAVVVPLLEQPIPEALQPTILTNQPTAPAAAAAVPKDARSP